MKQLASIPTASLPRSRYSSRNTCPPHVFDQITDMLAEMVLEDIKQYPKIPTGPRIDRFSGRENTVLPTQEAKE